uniref:Putative secreted protein n=1 Tax=Anopheles darlingi TaxID=43151 RepID=A0A2M4D9F1_ANODA
MFICGEIEKPLGFMLLLMLVPDKNSAAVSLCVCHYRPSFQLRSRMISPFPVTAAAAADEEEEEEATKEG